MVTIWRLGLLIFGCLLALGAPGHAGRMTDNAALCESAAEMASARTGVPVSVLKAISLNETGRKLNGQFRPWAWTVNMEGKGVWFETRDEARAYVAKEYQRGARSFDVGCFQINFKWHGEAFASIDAMFDPLENGIYAATFLKELYQEKGSWKAAAGAYHSRTPKYADRYAARFERFRENLMGEDVAGGHVDALPGARGEVPDIPDIVAANAPGSRRDRARVNTFPLFIRKEGGEARMGGASGASLFAVAFEKSKAQ
ncbi:transglycosylase SLT domain-containing protein [Pseudothioclava arenosa]|uniref:Transglycosylase n=1 Tax=Pseudothioclava arenosa TaxID=1795308 RepID=A0A2A4CPT2_9RHOB|nr:transglycosylase [Pseudothioclava arenosa]